MILRTVQDIDPNNVEMGELGQLAFSFGLIDMTEVLIVSHGHWAMGSEEVTQIEGVDNFRENIRQLLACAIVNFVSWKHELHEVELPAKTMERNSVQFLRIYPEGMHKDLGERYLAKAKELIAEYKPVEQVVTPAE